MGTMMATEMATLGTTSGLRQGCQIKTCEDGLMNGDEDPADPQLHPSGASTRTYGIGICQSFLLRRSHYRADGEKAARSETV